MAYEPQTWANGKTGGTPVSADRLDHIEAGIAGLATDGGFTGDATLNGVPIATTDDVLILTLALGA